MPKENASYKTKEITDVGQQYGMSYLLTNVRQLSWPTKKTRFII